MQPNSHLPVRLSFRFSIRYKLLHIGLQSQGSPYRVFGVGSIGNRNAARAHIGVANGFYFLESVFLNDRIEGGKAIVQGIN
jgi:hypothetical protein